MLKAFSTPPAPPRTASSSNDNNKSPSIIYPSSSIHQSMTAKLFSPQQKKPPLPSQPNSSANGKPPTVPPRPSPPSNMHRESIGTFYALALGVAVLVSALCAVYYYQRHRAVYEELVDYLDKSTSISKINYNPVLGLYSVRPEEQEHLNDHRRYKSLVGTFSLSEAGNFVLLCVVAFIYYYADIQRTRACRICFWVVLLLTTVYALVEAATFLVLVYPYSASLPNATEGILDHAVPHNPAGLMQMESRLDCIFNQNLYQAYKRKQNPENTCDPYILGSFLPSHLLILFFALRAMCLLLLVALLVGGLANPVGVGLARCVLRTRPSPGYKNRYIKNPHAMNSGAHKNGKFDFHTPKNGAPILGVTTFGVKADSSRPPSTLPPFTSPSPGQISAIDHSISYNNAAFFATSGAFPTANTLPSAPPVLGIFSSPRSSLTSKSDVADLVFNRGSTHTTNSIVSEV